MSLGELLGKLWDIVCALFTIVKIFWTNLLDVILILTETLSYIPYYLSWLPDYVVSLAVTCFVAVVLYKIIGREG